MRKIIIIFLMLSLFLLLLGCGPTELPFPLKEENTWTFEGDSGLITYKIVGAKENEDKGVKLYHMGSFSEGSMGQVDYYFQNEDGLYYYDTLKSEEPIPALIYPLEEGQKWSYGKGDNAIDFTILAKEDVSVPAGDFKDCYKIEFKPKAGNLTMIEWFCPRIGFVKYEITKEVKVEPKIEESEEGEKTEEISEVEEEPVYKTVTTVLELKSYSLN